ncbi:MAG: hypothetical protein OEN50_10890 [Deltaproteobacteria bacterium]|nr:hypothetical protein [Deltaproteobacteria bacterium]
MHGQILALLTLLFLLRVLGQALVVYAAVGWLPASEHWFSGIIPYPFLLAIQIVMLAGMIKISADIWRAEGYFAAPQPNWPRLLTGISALYAGSMAGRYILTMILHPDMRWLGGTIPIFFHFVLAGFIFMLGRYHAQSRHTHDRV